MATPEGASKDSLQLLSLPVEIETHIFSFLPFPTLQVLHATHPHFREVIDLRPSKWYQHFYALGTHDEHVRKPPYCEMVLEILSTLETDPFLGYRKLKPCACCLRLRSSEHFSKNMMKPKRHMDGFCFDCDLDPKHNRYPRGTRCNTQTQPAVHCQVCRVFKKGYDAQIVEKYTSFCRRCGEIADRPRQLREQRQKEEELERVTAARRANRRERNARLKETAGSDYEDWKSDSTVEETESEAFLRIAQRESEDFNEI
ncbi:hypothetical protein MMC34_006589 [Xylographa carneopallida]|nr:hypothetical protein [Xylographa carneopallida]